MQIDLTGKTALVTASSLGIGLAIAEGLHGAGAAVVLNGRDEARLAQAEESFSPGADVSAVRADVGTAAGCEALIEAVPEVDIVVSNSGAFGPQPFVEIEDWKWERLFAVNVLSGVRLARHYIEGMRARDWGRLLFVSSVDAVQVPANMVDYGATKLAQVGVSRGIAESLRGTGVTSNALLVGPTLSEGYKGFVGFGSYPGGSVLERTLAEGTLEEISEELLAGDQYSSSIIARLASCEEIANMAVFLASEQGAVTTGAALRLDGGCLRAVL
jgi:NAD(P)-dependent dehydrogenase (short-subunit alcohol dehydrogenase family)